jgi:hypothetical protein
MTTVASKYDAKEMFHHCALFSRLMSRLHDGEHVSVVTIDENVTDAIEPQLVVLVMNRNCDVWERRFTSAEGDAMLASLAPPVNGVTWPVFFRVLKDTYVEARLEFKPATRTLTWAMVHNKSSGCAAFSYVLPLVMEPATAATMGIGAVAEWLTTYASLQDGSKNKHDMASMARTTVTTTEAAAVGIALGDECVLMRREVAAFDREVAQLEAQIDTIADLMDNHSDPEFRELWRDALDAAVASMRGHYKASTAVFNKPVLGQVKEFINDKHNGPVSPSTTVVGGNSERDSEVESGNNSTTSSSLRSTNSFRGLRDPRVAAAAAYTVLGTFRDMRCCDVVAVDQVMDATELDAFEVKLVYALLNGGSLHDFDVDALDTLCRACRPMTHGALFYMGYTAMLKYDLLSHFNISERAFLTWLSAVEGGYRADVAFHNAKHAADVLHTIMFFLSDCKKEASKFGGSLHFELQKQDLLCLVLAAIVVDFEHPGKSNAAVVADGCFAAHTFAGSPHVLEHHHAAAAFALTRSARMDFMETFAPEQRSAVQQRVARLVVATDVASHTEFMAAAHQQVSNNFSHTAHQRGAVWDTELVMTILLRAADVSFVVKPHHAPWLRRKLMEDEGVALPVGRAAVGLADQSSADQTAAIEAHGVSAAAQEQTLHFINVVAGPVLALANDVLNDSLREIGGMLLENRKAFVKVSLVA